MTHPAHSSDLVALREEAVSWFVRRRDAGWRCEDEQAFQQWLAADARHEDMYAQCTSRWAAMDAMPPDLISHLRRAPIDAVAKPGSSGAFAMHVTPARMSGKGVVPVRGRRRRAGRLAAVACLFMLFGGTSFLLWRRAQNEPTFVASFHTSRGQILDVPLPDGTVLTLDTATQVEVTYRRHRREVKLVDGQAFFRVRHDTESPFDVFAGATRITVVGTRFAVRNIQAAGRNDGVEVAVEEGKVRVAPVEEAAGGAGRSQAIFLTARQRVATTQAGVSGNVSGLGAADVAPWREHQISFVDTPLSAALAELERYHPTGLVVHDATAAGLRLSGTFDPMEPEALAKLLPRILPVRLRPAPAGETEVFAVPGRR